jgi:hypothetical protein
MMQRREPEPAEGLPRFSHGALNEMTSPVKIMGYDALNSIQLSYCYRSVIPSY